MNGILKFFIKLCLIIGLVIFALLNYRILSFDKGWSIVEINNKSSTSAIQYIDYIPIKVEYYKKTFSNSEDKYKVFISTNDKNYLFDATQTQLDTLDFVSLFDRDIRPELITPVPFYVEIILGIIIIVLPFGKRKAVLDTTDAQ